MLDHCGPACSSEQQLRSQFPKSNGPPCIPQSKGARFPSRIRTTGNSRAEQATFASEGLAPLPQTGFELFHRRVGSRASSLSFPGSKRKLHHHSDSDADRCESHRPSALLEEASKTE